MREPLGHYALRKLRETGQTDAAFIEEVRARFAARAGAARRVPLPVEVQHLIAEAETLCRAAAISGLPKRHCGAEPPGTHAGAPIRCGLSPRHTLKIAHRDPVSGYKWWGEK